jgi:CheY-like chemotaxis protein
MYSMSGALSIVVVDDCEDISELLTQLLRESGHRVRLARHGSSALELLEAELPQVVFLDISLPGMDGYEVVGKIRARFGDAIRVIALTGLSGSGLKDRVRQAGFDDLIAKPFRSADVQNALRSLAS